MKCMTSSENCVWCKHGDITFLNDGVEGSLNMFCQRDERGEFITEFHNAPLLDDMIEPCNVECNDYAIVGSPQILVDRFRTLRSFWRGTSR